MSDAQAPDGSVATPDGPAVGASRRVVFAGAGAVGAAAVLAACGSDEDSGDGSGRPGPGTRLASTSDVEVGGGLILEDAELVLTQPTEGTFKAFSSICTHLQCPVTQITEDSLIRCTCHESRYSIEDGSVVEAAQGSGLTPETQDPLPEVAIEVDGDSIVMA